MFQTLSRLVAPVLLAACCLLAPALSQAAGQVRKAPAPGWVAVEAVPAPRAARNREVSDGQYTLLLDRQVRADGPVSVSYRRSANLVTDRGGLEQAASFSVDFDPSQDDVIFHHIRVWRGGVAQDRLKDVAIDQIRRERELSDGIITGMKTAHFELKDVRVGDVVDVAYSLETRDKVLRGQVFDGSSTTWSDPVGLTRFRVLWPHGRPLNVKLLGGAAQGTVTRQGDLDLYEWRAEDPDPVRGEGDTPRWRRPWAEVAVSSMASWAEVSAWAQPLYQYADPLPPALAAETDRFAAAHPDPRDRITWALRYAQDNVRYLSLSLGVGSYLPRSPAEVIRSGFGDCKDKARLLVALLRRLGVTATPALVDTELGAGLADHPAAPTLFDHMVVKITLDGRTYWVDPTRSHEGGRFPDQRPLPYAWALPVEAGRDRLEAIPFPPPAAPTMDVLETYVLPAGQAPLKLEVITTYRAEQADWMRADLAAKSPAEFEKKYLAYYADMYPGLKSVQAVAVEDDRANDVLVLREAYELSAEALAKDGLAGKFEVKASSFDDYKAPAPGERRTALSLAFPVNKHHRIVLITPGRKPPMPKSVTVDGVGFHYALETTRKGDTLVLDFRLTGVKPVLEPAEVATYRGEFSTLDDTDAWRLDLISKQGGVMGESPQAVWIGLGLCVALAGGLIFALIRGLKADAAYSDAGFYYPVSLWKFALMFVATFGLYAVFWTWKCWRWAKAHGRKDIQPFWRAVFQLFWLYPLFAEANRRGGKPGMPSWIGGVAAVAYAAWSIGDSLASRLPGTPELLKLSEVLAFVCYIPALLAVNRRNAADPQALKANSRITGLTLVALLTGAAVWALVVIGLNS